MTTDDLKLQVSGNTKVVASKGIYKFSAIQLLATPSYSTTLKFTSSSISDTIILAIDPTAKTCKFLHSYHLFRFDLGHILPCLCQR
jgi:hypothetical protein